MIKSLTILIFLLSAAVNIAAAQSLGDGINAYELGDYQTALNILAPLAETGDIEAQSMLGVMYYNGLGVTENNKRAYELFKKAAEQGNADARFNLGNMYLYSPTLPVEVEDRDVEAARWFFTASQQGHADAQYHLGLLLMTGSGVRQDPEEAYTWIKKAAEQGHPEAQNFIGTYGD